jgi:hypothetical protein
MKNFFQFEMHNYRFDFIMMTRSILNISFIFCKNPADIYLTFLLFDIDKTFGIIPAKSESLMFRNGREMKVRVYKHRVVILQQNYLFEKGGAVGCEKMSVDMYTSENHHRDPINSSISRKNFVI